jgi:hypothetical protein
MKLRSFAIAFVLSAWFGCQCGGPTDPCAQVRCGTGLSCDPTTGACVIGGAGGGGSTATGGGGTTTCLPACAGTTPVCDVTTLTCVTCTATSGCSGATPACLTTGNAGQGSCVQCVMPADCAIAGSTCDGTTHTCVNPSTGGGSGTTGGGSGVTGGGSGVTGGGQGGGSVGPPMFDDAGMTAHCANFAGPPGQACTNSEQCAHGYDCIAGACELRGHSGPVQVTLRWGTQTDLDLYLVEPLLDGGTCEIYYQNPGPVPCSDPLHLGLCLPDGGFALGLGGTSCDSKGWLDLDANRGCDMQSLTNSPVENIIYSPGISVTSGTYTVRVNNWSICSLSPPIPWEVEVRANGLTRFYCGQFQTSGNGGSAGAGNVVTTFTLP